MDRKLFNPLKCKYSLSHAIERIRRIDETRRIERQIRARKAYESLDAALLRVEDAFAMVYNELSLPRTRFRKRSEHPTTINEMYETGREWLQALDLATQPKRPKDILTHWYNSKMLYYSELEASLKALAIACDKVHSLPEIESREQSKPPTTISKLYETALEVIFLLFPERSIS
jgi:ribosomal protein S21